MRYDREKIKAALGMATEWSLYALIFALPFSKTMIEICSIVAISCWFIRKILSGRDALRPVHAALNRPLFTFYAIAFLSIFWSTHSGISVSAFVRKSSEYLLLYLVVIDTINDKRTARNAILALASSAFLVSLDVFYQKLTGYDFVRNYPLFSLEQVTASFKFPNGLGAWILVVLLPFVSMALFYKSKITVRAGSAFLALLLLICLFLTHNRGAIMSFIPGLALLVFLKNRKAFYGLCVLAIIAVALILFTQRDSVAYLRGIKYWLGLSDLFASVSSQHRMRMWETGWRMFMDRPLLGQGLNTFMANYERFRVPGEYGVWYAHNGYLQIAAEMGVFGLLAFLWMIFRLAADSIRSWRLINDGFLRYFYLGLFCGLVSFLTHTFVDTTFYALKLAVLFYLSLGLLMAIKKVGIRD